MEATTQTRRTPRAEAALRRANAEAYRLAADPARCIAMWERLAIPLIAPAIRAEAKQTFREYIVDDQFRLSHPRRVANVPAGAPVRVVITDYNAAMSRSTPSMRR